MQKPFRNLHLRYADVHLSGNDPFVVLNRGLEWKPIGSGLEAGHFDIECTNYQFYQYVPLQRFPNLEAKSRHRKQAHACFWFRRSPQIPAWNDLRLRALQ